MRTDGTRIVLSSVLLMSFLGEAHASIGAVMNTRASAFDVSQEDGMEEIEQQFARLCIDDPYLKYLHFDANLGSTSFEDCTWVSKSPDDRCMLQASHGGQSMVGSAPSTLLRDKCPLSCGLCPPDLIDYATTEIERDIDYMTDDEITLEEIEALEIKLRRKKRNFKTKKKGRKPCPCPDGQNQGGEDGGDLVGDAPDEPQAPAPTPTQAPTRNAAGPDPGTESPTFFPTSFVTSEETTEGTLAATFSETSIITSTYTSMYTSSFTSTSSSIDNGAVITSAISGQQSMLNDGHTRRVIVSLSIASILLLLLTLCCLARWRKKRNADRGSKDDSDKDDSDTDESGPKYPIHQTKSADSVDSFLQRVLVHFNGQRDDARTDVHTCSSAVCDVCEETPRRVMSIGSYKNQHRKKKAQGERYRVKEMEC